MFRFNPNLKFVGVGLMTVSLIAVSLFAYTLLQAPAMYQNGEYFTPLVMQYHVDVWIQRVGEDPMFWSHHAGVLTTIGKNWLEDQIGDSPSTTPASYISLSLSASSPSAAWTQIPSEIADGNGLARALAAYASTGDGQWTELKQFTASGSYVSVQLTGLQYGSSGDNNLLCSDTFTPVTLASGDKITVTWTITVS
jgi:hypothetical protein